MRFQGNGKLSYPVEMDSAKSHLKLAWQLDTGKPPLSDHFDLTWPITIDTSTRGPHERTHEEEPEEQASLEECCLLPAAH